MAVMRRLNFLAGEECRLMVVFDELKPRLAEAWRITAELVADEKLGSSDPEKVKRQMADALAIEREASDLARRQRLIRAEVTELNVFLENAR